jgi:hypothetical protein
MSGVAEYDPFPRELTARFGVRKIFACYDFKIPCS